ncbi:MAG: hypothetical protein ICV62_10705 [Cyanobacteria bacterium Co-bin13]|nr:hypothetical protein [Cyanobacteria bacterium Co-bin13]
MEIILILGALIVIVLFAGWLFKLVGSTLRTLLFIGFVLLVLWVVFGVGPSAIWQQIQQLVPGGSSPPPPPPIR